MSNTILVEEQSFIGTYDSSASAYYYSPNGTPFNNETIFVDFDGVMYECQTRGSGGFDTYGAVFTSARSYDWSVYPFYIESVTYDPEEAYLLIAVSDDSEHTITIYSELPAPVVRDYIDKVDLNGTEYDIKDTTSGYISEIVAGSNVTINLDSEGNPVISASGGSSSQSTLTITYDADNETLSYDPVIAMSTDSEWYESISSFDNVRFIVAEADARYYHDLIYRLGDSIESYYTFVFAAVEPDDDSLSIYGAFSRYVNLTNRSIEKREWYKNLLQAPKNNSGVADGKVLSVKSVPYGWHTEWTTIPVTDVQVNGTSAVSSGVVNLVTNTAYNASSNKIATMADVGHTTIRRWS